MFLKKALSLISDLSVDAKDILKDNNIELTISDLDNPPNTKELIALLENYDILIIGVRTKVSKEILEYIKEPKIIATLSIGLDHIDKEIRESKLIHVLNIKNANILLYKKF